VRTADEPRDEAGLELAQLGRAADEQAGDRRDTPAHGVGRHDLDERLPHVDRDHVRSAERRERLHRDEERSRECEDERRRAECRHAPEHPVAGAAIVAAADVAKGTFYILQTGVDVYLDRSALHDVVFHQFRPDEPRARHTNPIVGQLAEFLANGTRAGAWSVATPISPPSCCFTRSMEPCTTPSTPRKR
jgi:hypothetical protein